MIRQWVATPCLVSDFNKHPVGSCYSLLVSPDPTSRQSASFCSFSYPFSQAGAGRWSPSISGNRRRRLAEIVNKYFIGENQGLFDVHNRFHLSLIVWHRAFAKQEHFSSTPFPVNTTESITIHRSAFFLQYSTAIPASRHLSRARSLNPSLQHLHVAFEAFWSALDNLDTHKSLGTCENPARHHHRLL